MTVWLEASSGYRSGSRPIVDVHDGAAELAARRDARATSSAGGSPYDVAVSPSASSPGDGLAAAANADGLRCLRPGS